MTYLAMSVSWRFSRFESYSEPKVSNDCCQVFTQQHIFTLEVPEKNSSKESVIFHHRKKVVLIFSTFHII